jgi:cell wall-associated NlpC family hydrolase
MDTGIVWNMVKKRKPKRNYNEDAKNWEADLIKTKSYDEIVDIVLAEARSWIGVPFHHQGRTKAGCDCVAIAISCAQKIGCDYEDWTKYGRLPHGGKLEKSFANFGVRIPISDIRPADGVLMTWKVEPHHVGIITRMETGELGILHSYAAIGHVVEHHLNDLWKKRIVLAFRFPILHEKVK